MSFCESKDMFNIASDIPGEEERFLQRKKLIERF